jgi:hypothetical protein
MARRWRSLARRRGSDACVNALMNEDRDRLNSVICIGVSVFLAILVFAVVLLLPLLPLKLSL